MKRVFGQDHLGSPLGQVRNLGSAREGAEHFIAQRLTAIALIPLLIWFVCCLASIATADYATIVAWIRNPVVTGLLILLILFMFYHAHAGLEEVFEDYLHNSVIKALAMVSMKFFFIMITVAAVLSILYVAFGE